MQNYLSGRPVSTAQTAGITWAVKQYGAAPEGTTGTSKIVKP